VNKEKSSREMMNGKIKEEKVKTSIMIANKLMHQKRCFLNF